MTWFCWLANLAGLPCISIPCGISSTGMPIGMMVMAKAGEDEKLIDIVHKMDFSINP